MPDLASPVRALPLGEPPLRPLSPDGLARMHAASLRILEETGVAVGSATIRDRLAAAGARVDGDPRAPAGHARRGCPRRRAALLHARGPRAGLGPAARRRARLPVGRRERRRDPRPGDRRPACLHRGRPGPGDATRRRAPGDLVPVAGRRGRRSAGPGPPAPRAADPAGEQRQARPAHDRGHAACGPRRRRDGARRGRRRGCAASSPDPLVVPGEPEPAHLRGRRARGRPRLRGGRRARRLRGDGDRLRHGPGDAGRRAGPEQRRGAGRHDDRRDAGARAPRPSTAPARRRWTSGPVSSTCGGPEDLLYQAAFAQLARHYRLPVSVGTFAPGAKSPDWQAGLENGLSGLVSLLAGADMLSGAGLLYAARVFALEEMVLDAEIFGLVRHLAGGITVDDAHARGRRHRRGGPRRQLPGGGPHDRPHARPLAAAPVRPGHVGGLGGRRPARHRAIAPVERARSLLATHVPPPLPDGVGGASSTRSSRPSRGRRGWADVPVGASVVAIPRPRHHAGGRALRAGQGLPRGPRVRREGRDRRLRRRGGPGRRAADHRRAQARVHAGPRAPGRGPARDRRHGVPRDPGRGRRGGVGSVRCAGAWASGSRRCTGRAPASRSSSTPGRTARATTGAARRGCSGSMAGDGATRRPAAVPGCRS